MASTSSSATSSSWATFMKTILIPLFAAALLYTVIFIVGIPLYRRYKNNIARYSAYAPLDSDLGRRTTSLFAPYIIQPGRSLFQKVREGVRRRMWRWLVPGVENINFPTTGQDMPRRDGWNDEDEEMQTSTSPERTRVESDEEGEGGLFDAETGQSMVGFDVRDDVGDGRGFRLGRQRLQRSQMDRDERARRFAREMTGQIEPVEVEDFGGQRRLSRELEGTFGDESDGEEDAGVVVGRDG